MCNQALLCLLFLTAYFRGFRSKGLDFQVLPSCHVWSFSTQDYVTAK